jgi:cathepsin L
VKKRDELALMWAVAKHGPVAVSLDASQPSFKFYSEGVYSAKHCLTKKVSAQQHAWLRLRWGVRG